MSSATQNDTGALEFDLMGSADILVGWDVVFKALWLSGLYDDPRQVSALMHDGLKGKTSLWMLKRRYSDDTLQLAGFLGTQMYRRPYQSGKTLMVIHGHTAADQHISEKEWMKSVLKPLMRYAKGEGCRAIEVFSDVGRVGDLLVAFGFTQRHLYRKEF